MTGSDRSAGVGCHPICECRRSEVDGGTLLTITESGFEQIPLDRRTKAKEGNDAGWAHQTKLIEKYLVLDEQS
ncbi:hypothetical protein [Rhizobium jaguaris]|uniref:hypothetical protein n=1 Tax=Rhizobium jaguaris TaxID=1312183 RepID=UPI0013C4A3F3|nr:hypothetical protein [Rhizobium jaguaris]